MSSSSSSPLYQNVEKQNTMDAMGHAGIYTGRIEVSSGLADDDKANGHMEYLDNNTSIASYTGSWHEGYWQGQGTCVLQNGDSYQGQFKNHERHGSGEYLWKAVIVENENENDDDTTTSTIKQRSFQGEFQHNQRQGHGKYLWKTTTTTTTTTAGGGSTSTNVSTSTSTYVGLFDNGQRQGHGVYTSPKLQYTGDWLAGQYHGYGVLQMLVNKKSTYRGYFVRGKKEGRGVETLMDGSVRHEGQWNQDKPVPQHHHDNDNDTLSASQEQQQQQQLSSSKLISTVWSTPQELPDGDGVVGMYTGIVEQGLPQGVGTMTYQNYYNNNKHTTNNNGDLDNIAQYEGFWQGGIRHGFGRLSKTNGDSYQGNFVLGTMQGRGEYTTTSTTNNDNGIIVYKGMFQKAKPHGTIKAIYPGDTTASNEGISYYDGDYANGQREGTGTFVFGDGSSYKGTWKQGWYHDPHLGELVTLKAVYKGAFENGKYHGQGCLTSLSDNAVVYQGEWKGGNPVVASSATTIRIDKALLEIPQPPEDTAFAPPPSPPPPLAVILSKLSPVPTPKQRGAAAAVATTNNNNNNGFSSSKEQQEREKEEPRKAVVDISVFDGQDNPGRYTGILHIASQRPHGVGRMVYNDGNRIHEGFWEFGDRQGHGRCLFVQIGDYHEGNYHQNLRHGPGKYLWKDGRQFIGNYQDDERAGEGKFVYPNGDVYNGNFEKGQRHGYGTFVFGGSSKTCEYHGEWNRGVYGGQGKLQWKAAKGETRMYEGAFLQGLFHGPGKESTVDPTVIGGGEAVVVLREGTWQKGKFIAPSLDELTEPVATLELNDENGETEKEEEQEQQQQQQEQQESQEQEEQQESQEQEQQQESQEQEQQQESQEQQEEEAQKNLEQEEQSPKRESNAKECATSLETNYETQRLNWRGSLEPANN